MAWLTFFHSPKNNDCFFLQIVFIPIWIVMCVSMIGVIYAIILAIILLVKSPNIIPEQRRGNLTTAIGYPFLVIPMLIFEVSMILRHF